MSFRVTKPRRFVAEWLRFHRLNVITIKQLFYLHLLARKRRIAELNREWAR